VYVFVAIFQTANKLLFIYLVDLSQ